MQRLRYLRRAQGLSPSGRASLRYLRRPALVAVAVVALLAPRPTASDNDQAVRPGQATPSAGRVGEVWLVEDKGGIELYSNGLRVESRHAIDGEKRSYPVYDRDSLAVLEWRAGKVGIVYHTTESHVAPFDATHNQRLQNVGQWLLDYVRKNASYHFVIDRFGRAHRIVREAGAANHAGYSVWADNRRIYVNLNSSFLGVAFETQMRREGGGAEVTQAQVDTARVLTQMLMAKHEIPPGNCVTHAQVSVAPWNMRIGNHTDWSDGFPFGALGLGDNYGIPLPSVALFGFAYDQHYLKTASRDLWRGVVLGEDSFRHRAAARGLSAERHRDAVRKRYREILKGLDKVVDAVEKTT
ncbi:MAG: N-acetylmuramoyl-L-alanine amidase [Bryobacteraceae bacterium]|nr:N-acetylmuramoyl-L-alanine amidase [Bryobacteraceae bacterium]